MSGQPARECRAVVNIAGGHYGCELTHPHIGWAHSNAEAQAIWVSDVENPASSATTG